MKTLLSMLTVTATALMLAATSLAGAEAKNEVTFIRNQRHHLAVYAATTPPPTYYQALKERYPGLF